MRIMPELLNSLDTDSYTEKCFLLFILFWVIFYFISSLPDIHIWSNQKWFYHFCIRNSIYMDIYHIYLFYMPLLLAFFSCNLEYSNGRFFFFRLSFNLFEWKQGNVSLWSELGLSLSFICFYSYLFSLERTDPI